MECNCEYGCGWCSNYPISWDYNHDHEETKCEGCNFFICECGMEETPLYSYNPNTKHNRQNEVDLDTSI